MKILKDEIFVLLSLSDFTEIINDGFSFLNQDHGEINGLMIGNMIELKCYITMLIGDTLLIKENLLNTFESHIQLNHQVHEMTIHFMNPVSLPWYPKKNIVHPCYPGVELNEENYELYLSHGYLVHSIQDIYYLNLSSFRISDKVLDQFNKNKSRDIEIALYDTNKHTGLNAFAEDIQAPHWKDVILNNQNANPVLPLLVALKENSVIGFTGPLKVESNGRGYFAGIGILESERGQKIGKTLFFMLCQELKNMGATYMTLYTGNLNPARFIYLDAGFKILKSFATMKKVLK